MQMFAPPDFNGPNGVRRFKLYATWLAYFSVFLLSIALFFVVDGKVEAVSQAQDPAKIPSPSFSHFNGLHTLSGGSYRAFINRLKRQMNGKRCLRYHVAGTWWHYEWCIDRYVRQFHPAKDKDVGKRQSILLGVYNAKQSPFLRVVAVEHVARLADPDRMGYMTQQRYSDGDFCPAKNTRRAVSIQVNCCIFRDNETYVDVVEERSVCEYEVRVCSPVACGFMQRDQFVLTAPTVMKEEERRSLIETVKDMFYHAYRSYLTYAFPQDDLQPLLCRGRKFELGRLPLLTLIDTLDTLAVMGDAVEFQRAVKLVIKNADFDLDTEVSVFETTIRVLGGLLSAHLFAINTDLKLFPDGQYDNELLSLAVDLCDRLMPAFETVTGIPYGTVNLKYGVPKGETPIASTAGAGSLSLEFTMVSVLTGEPKYAAASRKAVRSLFRRRSRIGLVGKHIDTDTGHWTETISGPGSNSDSFYEYLLKMYELFGDQKSLEMFLQMYPSVLAYNKHGDWYMDVFMYSGCHNRKGDVIFESLTSFWPGMQVAVGDLNAAANSLNSFYRIWRNYGFLAEEFNVTGWRPIRRNRKGRYPLRPELIESTFYMHEATNDSSWLRAGAHVVHSLQKYAKTPCGYASIADVESKTQEDYMPSFFLSETCKYLYLLFNTSHFFRQGHYVMTTEAHPFPILPRKLVAPILRAADAYVNTSHVTYDNRFSPDRVLTCAAPKFYDLIYYSIHYKGEVVARTPRCSPRSWYQRALNWKKIPTKAVETVAITASDKTNPTTAKSQTQDGNLVVQYLDSGSKLLGDYRVEQLPGRLRVVQEKTSDWIEVSGVLDDAYVLIGMGSNKGERNADSFTFESAGRGANEQTEPPNLPFHHVYRTTNEWSLFVDQRCSLHVLSSNGLNRSALPRDEKRGVEDVPNAWFTFPCIGAEFGLTSNFESSRVFPSMELVVADPGDACSEVSKDDVRGKLLLVERGGCYFETKAWNAAKWGASGVIVVNTETEDQVMIMGGIVKETKEASKSTTSSLNIPVVMVPQRLGDWFKTRLAEAQVASVSPLHVSVELIVRHHTREVGSARGREMFPRVEGMAGNMKIYGPSWGIELTTVDLDGQESQEEDDQVDFNIGIIATPPWQH
ncbi:hypothetical protein PsorP6_008829 [Peronosclerospora sorghi]|uniref:Uncharacterized protein n=1 Tax=Peronosclerospora sorghi TaxID=230839 RepID=A0ACC0VZN0_9STRA|nr:hypothetical protein PsorP6_008829 [Peronosclerospora sorghi]